MDKSFIAGSNNQHLSNTKMLTSVITVVNYIEFMGTELGL